MADKRKLATEIERTLKQVRRRMVYSAEGAFGDVADRPLGGGPGAGRSLRACPALPRPSRGIAAVLGVRRRRCTAAARLASRQGPRRLAYSCNRITPSGSHSSGRRATGTWARGRRRPTARARPARCRCTRSIHRTLRLGWSRTAPRGNSAPSGAPNQPYLIWRFPRSSRGSFLAVPRRAVSAVVLLPPQPRPRGSAVARGTGC